MQMSDKGRALLTKREGVRLKAYKDSVGIWTIGIGHTSAAGPPHVTPGLTITAAECDEIFRRDLVQYENAVNNAVKRPLAQHQFDACVSLCYNIGTGGFARSSVVRKINAGDMDGAAEAFMMWVKPPEITGRRRTEVAQFRTPYSNQPKVTPAVLPVAKTAPVDAKDTKQLVGAGIGAATVSAGVGAATSNGAGWYGVLAGGLKVFLVIAALFAFYWFIARPILRRMSALDEFYAKADEFEGNMLMRVRLALKGVKTLLWGRFLALAPMLGVVLQFTDVVDFSVVLKVLPSFGPFTPEMYGTLIGGAALAWVNNALRKASTTPAGQTDLALAPEVPSPPLAPDAPAQGDLPVIVKEIKAKRPRRAAKTKRTKRAKVRA
jgi:lysozyme